MGYVRYCPQCGREKRYKTLTSFITNKNSLLCRSCAKKKTFSKLYHKDLSLLLEDTPEAYYWIGFLLADGHASNNKRIRFTQKIKDKVSVEKFANFIGVSDRIKYSETTSSISVMDTDVIAKIMDKFDIKSDKTYNPPNIEIFKKMDADLLAYLFIGFVDGDGNIGNVYKRKDFFIRIKLHKSWVQILDVFKNRLFNDAGSVKVNKSGYVVLYIGDTEKLKKFKIRYFDGISFEPLKRKWDIIDISFIGKYELHRKNTEKIIELIEKGYDIKQICETLKLKYSMVYKCFKQYKNS